MTNGSWIVSEDTPLGDAAEILLRRRIRRLPVINGKKRMMVFEVRLWISNHEAGIKDSD